MQKIPVFKTFGNMVDSIIENLGAAFSMSWPWLLVLFPIRAAGDIYHLAIGTSRYDFHSGANVHYDVVDIIVWLISLFIFSSIAVNWHRFVLLGELAEGSKRFRVDRLVWRYFGYALLIVLFIFLLVIGEWAVFVAVVSLFSVASKTLGSVVGGIGFLIIVPLLLLIFGMSARWSVKQVAIALGDTNFTFANAWNATKKNTWRLSGLYILLFLAIILVTLMSLAAAYGASTINSAIASAAVAALTIFVGWFSTLMGITMLTSIYAFFVEKKQF